MKRKIIELILHNLTQQRISISDAADMVIYMCDDCKDLKLPKYEPPTDIQTPPTAYYNTCTSTLQYTPQDGV